MFKPKCGHEMHRYCYREMVENDEFCKFCKTQSKAELVAKVNDDLNRDLRDST